jgi:hypothetical protein
MSKTKRLRLLNISYVSPPPVAVAYSGPDLGTSIPHNDADIRDARIHQVFDRIKENRLISYGHQLLGACICNRAKTRAFASAQNESLHKPSHPSFSSQNSIKGQTVSKKPGKSEIKNDTAQPVKSTGSTKNIKPNYI